MNADTFSGWLSLQGYKVIRTESSYWFEIGPRIYQAFPYHWQISPGEEELERLLKKNRAIGARYSSPFQSKQGLSSYHVVYSGEDYLLEILNKKARYDVRKGLKNFDVEPITFRQLEDDGWSNRADTLERQGRTDAEDRKWWERLCQCSDGMHGFEAWGAFSREYLVASLIGFTCDDCFSILYQQSMSDVLSDGVNNALIYIVTNEVLKRPDINSVFYGLHSVDAPGSVDRFKFRMGFQALPVRQRVVFNPWIAPIFNQVSHKIIKKAVNKFPEKPFLTKTEGMIRFFLEGSKPLGMQCWPDGLRDQKERILADHKQVTYQA